MNADDLAWLEVLTSARRGERIVTDAFRSADRKRIDSVTVATFHCSARRSCTLLTVWQTPEGLMFYRPRYRLSPTVNAAESNESGRRNNTEDGDRRWLPGAGNLDRLRSWGDRAGLALNCDHLHRVVMVTDLFPIVDSGRPGRPTRHVVTSRT